MFSIGGNLAEFLRANATEVLRREIESALNASVEVSVRAGSIIATAHIANTTAGQVTQFTRDVAAGSCNPLRSTGFQAKSLSVTLTEQEAGWYIDLSNTIPTREYQVMTFMHSAVVVIAAVLLRQSIDERLSALGTLTGTMPKGTKLALNECLFILVGVAAAFSALSEGMFGFVSHDWLATTTWALTTFYVVAAIALILQSWCFTLFCCVWALAVHNVRTGGTLLGSVQKYLAGFNAIQAVVIVVIWSIYCSDVVSDGDAAKQQDIKFVGELVLSVPLAIMALVVLVYGGRLIRRIEESKGVGSDLQQERMRRAEFKILKLAIWLGATFLLKAVLNVVSAVYEKDGEDVRLYGVVDMALSILAFLGILSQGRGLDELLSYFSERLSRLSQRHAGSFRKDKEPGQIKDKEPSQSAVA